MKKVVLAAIVCAFLALISIQPAEAAPPEYGPFIHIVQWGETLGGIAARYGTSVGAILRANWIANPDRIYAGQRLRIPARTGPYYPPGGGWGGGYVVRHGDTLSGIAYRFGVSVNALVRVNGIVNRNRIYAGQRLRIPGGGGGYYPGGGGYYPPAGGGRYYRVRAGDTLSGIAWRYGVTTWSIANANGLSNPNVIYAGQSLYIP
jgi:putative chitinase